MSSIFLPASLTILGFTKLIVFAATATVEGRGHQSHAQADHASNAEQCRNTDLAVVAEQIEPQHVTENDNKPDDQHNTCKRVPDNPRQFAVLGGPQALDEVYIPRHLVARGCKATTAATFGAAVSGQFSMVRATYRDARMSLQGPGICARRGSRPETEAGRFGRRSQGRLESRACEHVSAPQGLIHAMVWIIPPSTRRAAPLVAEASFEQT